MRRRIRFILIYSSKHGQPSPNVQAVVGDTYSTLLTTTSGGWRAGGGRLLSELSLLLGLFRCLGFGGRWLLWLLRLWCRLLVGFCLLLVTRWLRFGLVFSAALCRRFWLLAPGTGRATELDADQVLPDCDGVLFADEKFLDGSGLRGIDCDVDLCVVGAVSARSLAACSPRQNSSSQRTLSVSIVAISSSCSTYSPIPLENCFNVPSDIDSAICGTLTTLSAYPRTTCIIAGSATSGLLRGRCCIGRSDAMRAATAILLDNMAGCVCVGRLISVGVRSSGCRCAE